MINLFDSTPPTEVPEELVAGALWTWTLPEVTAAYPVADYTAELVLGLQVAPYTAISITASKGTGEHVFSKADTDAAAAGEYAWRLIITRDDDNAKVVADEGWLVVRPKLATGVDSSSWVYQVLQAIRSVIAGRASQAVHQYTIRGRALTHYSPTELLALEKEFAKRWKEEERKAGRNTTQRRSLLTMRA